ncbi:NPCBM/NEW2 domain-containing protein [uncultured Corynebacterium sp.]|uniref:NPCBM/NEW2 domain-containing protein n=1 Tax=uncultured Corynebacterium sp. TaxID=159447 RepID=UPI0028EC31A0|nr:NPCBM/NEW2 domain-containing protein [uncultured Corynebacterium sp.]
MNLSDFNWPLFIPSAITLIAGVLSIIFASKSKTVRQVGVLLVGVGIVLCVAGLFVPNNDPNQTTAEPPTSTPMNIPTSSVAAATPTTPTTTATATTDANAASVGTDPYLAELKVLQDASDVYYNKTYEVSGQPYVHSILADCGSNCTTQKKISYNLGKKYRKLTFGVGIEDNSATREQVAVFTLIADGKPIFEKTAQKNEPVTSQEVDVTNVLTLELAVTATKNKSSQLVWMTPQLHS